MGTRHVIVVKSNNQKKLVNYGQWDGYASGQGVKVLEFLKISNLSEFKKKIDNLSFYTEEEVEKIYDEYDTPPPELNRDTGAKILNLVYIGSVRKVRDSTDSVGWTEYQYVIDLDEMKLEVYNYFGKGEKKYEGFNLAVSFDLNKLPSEEEFIAAVEEATSDPSPYV